MKKFTAILLTFLLSMSLLTGCLSNVNPTDTTNGASEPLFTLENYPKLDASLALHPLVNAIASDFMDIPVDELDFEYTKTRSSEVYHNLIDGKVDVIFASAISEEDKEYAAQQGVELNIIPATSSAFVFIVNTANQVDNLTLDEIQRIYTGEITNWKEVGGKDAPIIAYQRPVGSGSQTAMLSLVMKGKTIMTPPTDRVQGEMGEIIDAVAEYDNADTALGYSYFYYVTTMYKRDTIKMLSVDSVEPTFETIQNGEYPLYTNAYIVTRSDADENTLKWVDAVLGERGNKIIAEEGYVPLKK